MARDTFSDRFGRKQKNQRLSDLGQAGRSPDDIDAEKEMIDNAEKVEPIHAEKAPGRNDPCPCGSGKKYKKCCGRK